MRPTLKTHDRKEVGDGVWMWTPKKPSRRSNPTYWKMAMKCALKFGLISGLIGGLIGAAWALAMGWK